MVNRKTLVGSHDSVVMPVPPQKVIVTLLSTAPLTLLGTKSVGREEAEQYTENLGPTH